MAIHLPNQHIVTFNQNNQNNYNDLNNNNPIHRNNNYLNQSQNTINDHNTNSQNNSQNNNNTQSHHGFDANDPNFFFDLNDENVYQRRQEFLRVLNRNNDTTLMAFFKLNQEFPEARQYLYRDIPKYFYYDKPNHCWLERQNPRINTVGRIYSVHSKDTERFAMRLLLNHVRGPTSFENLRTVNGITYPTFQSAAIERGIMADSNEAIQVLNEAYQHIRQPQAYREFFAHYLINSPNLQVGLLWQNFKDHLSEDFLFDLRETHNNPTLQFNDMIHTRGLIEINKIFQLEGLSLTHFPELPQLTAQIIGNVLTNFGLNYTNQNNFTVEYSLNLLNNNLPLLNDDQRLIYNTIIYDYPAGY